MIVMADDTLNVVYAGIVLVAVTVCLVFGDKVVESIMRTHKLLKKQLGMEG
jgi:hypothetical protein